MKFKKDGNVFEDIALAFGEFCQERRCRKCSLNHHYDDCGSCSAYVEAHPAEATRLMGYEVVEDEPEKEANMDKQTPRICEVLGVEVGQRFRVDYPKGMTQWLHIQEDGRVAKEYGSHRLKIGNSVVWAINHPESVIRLTQTEVKEKPMTREEAIRKIEYGLEMETSEPTPFGQLTVVRTEALRMALSALLDQQGVVEEGTP